MATIPPQDEKSQVHDHAGFSTGAVRGLRLSLILVSLREKVEPLPETNSGASAECCQRKYTRKTRFDRRPRRSIIRSNITLGEIVDETAHAGFGFLAAFLALVAIPFMGLSLPFGMAVAFLGLQMIAGKNRPWLPRRIRRYVVTIATIDWIGGQLTRWTTGLERFIGVGLVLQGLGLALPISIPASNWAFVLLILVYAIGLSGDAGVLVSLGHILTRVLVVAGFIF